MEYLHPSSIPAIKSEMDLFSAPPTQTTIESSYEVAYRPSASLDSSRTYEFSIPASDDFTDLAATMVYVKFKILNDTGGDLAENEDCYPVKNFGKALFDQVDFYLGNVNITTANNLYHYQAFFEDLLFRHKSQLDYGSMNTEDAKERQSRIKDSMPCDLFFRLHVSLCSQNKLLVNGIPITIRMIRGNDNFAMYSETAGKKYIIKFQDLAIYIKRCRIYPDVQLGVTNALQSTPISYFVTRNEVKQFSIAKGLSAASFENVFTGALPRRLLIGLIDDEAFHGSTNTEPYKFEPQKISHIDAYVDGVQYPSLAHEPDFSGVSNLYMREFINLYRFFKQDEGIPQMDVSYDDFEENKCLFAFDLSPD